MSKPDKKQLAAAALMESLGIVQRPAPKLSDAQKFIADLVAGRSTPQPGTKAAELAAAHYADAHRHSGEHEPSDGVVARQPSDELREVITDVLRSMHARGELK